MAKNNDMFFDEFFDTSSLKKDEKEKDVQQKKINEEKKKTKEIKKTVDKEAKENSNETDLIEYFRRDVDKGNLHRTSINITSMQHEILTATAMITGMQSEGASGLMRTAIREYMEKELANEDVKNKVTQILQLKGILK